MPPEAVSMGNPGVEMGAPGRPGFASSNWSWTTTRSGSAQYGHGLEDRREMLKLQCDFRVAPGEDRHFGARRIQREGFSDQAIVAGRKA